MKSPWAIDGGIVRTIQPHARASKANLHSSRRDISPRPFIVETLRERRLQFSEDDTQSVMRLDDPDALVAAYTQKMMSFLLFTPRPGHILMIGLGGGSLAKFCYRHFPTTHITVVEISAEVIALRDEFCIPKDDRRFRVIHGDGAYCWQQSEECFDVILVDAFDAEGIALSLPKSAFYARAAERLSPTGVLVMNLVGPIDRYVDNVRAIGSVFGGNILLVPVGAEDNVLLFAMKRNFSIEVTSHTATRAEQLQSKLQLDFPRFLRRLSESCSFNRS